MRRSNHCKHGAVLEERKRKPDVFAVYKVTLLIDSFFVTDCLFDGFITRKNRVYFQFKLNGRIRHRTVNRDLKHRQRNGRRRRFGTKQTGPRVSFSAGKTKFKQGSFRDRRRLFVCEEVCLVTAFKGLRNLHLISYDDG